MSRSRRPQLRRHRPSVSLAAGHAPVHRRTRRRLQRSRRSPELSSLASTPNSCDTVVHPYRLGLTEAGESALGKALDLLTGIEILTGVESGDQGATMPVQSVAALTRIVIGLLRQVSSGLEPMPQVVQQAWQADLEAWQAV